MDTKAQVGKKLPVLLFAFARSGGTILNRYLAADDRLICLSEINSRYVCPTQPNTVSSQLKAWYGTDIQAGTPMPELRSAIEVARQQKKILVIRDWSFGSFVPLKYNDFVSKGSLNTLHDLRELTSTPIESIALVRHPFDVWLSMATSEKTFHDKNLDYYFQFCLELVKNRVMTLKYEDLCRSPEIFIENLYSDIGLEAPERLTLSHNVIGDTNYPDSSRGSLLDHAARLSRRTHDTQDRAVYENRTRGPEIERLLQY